MGTKKRCASCGFAVRSGESRSHSCSASSMAYSEPAWWIDWLRSSIFRDSPCPAPGRYWSSVVVNSDGCRGRPRAHCEITTSNVAWR
eukprot:5238741-Prymnesium_polylepis.1